jgi:hypothetical protein
MIALRHRIRTRELKNTQIDTSASNNVPGSVGALEAEADGVSKDEGEKALFDSDSDYVASDVDFSTGAGPGPSTIGMFYTL